jgi:hypothetical protein
MRLDVIAVCYIQNESTDSPVDFDKLHCKVCYHLRPVMLDELLRCPKHTAYKPLASNH